MKKEHAIYLLVSIVVGASACTALGKLSSREMLEAVALVLAYLAPSPVLADVSKKAGE